MRAPMYKARCRVVESAHPREQILSSRESRLFLYLVWLIYEHPPKLDTVEAMGNLRKVFHRRPKNFYLENSRILVSNSKPGFSMQSRSRRDSV